MGSKALAAEVEWGPSTIRHELANLEELGLLAHPHTSAGRVPTEAGYRYFVDRLLPAEPEPHTPSLSLSLVRRELDEAMRVTTETLSQVTNLLAIVTAPPIETSTIRHVEVLVLQPQVVMVVVITSTGGVTRRCSRSGVPSTPASPTGRPPTSTSGWSGSGLGARMLLGAAARPVAVGDRIRVPRRAGAGVHPSRGRARGAGDAVRRRHLAAAARESGSATSPS